MRRNRWREKEWASSTRRPPADNPCAALRPRTNVSIWSRFYKPHHAALTTAVQTALDAHGTCLMIDGHSFPTHALPYEDDQNPHRPDICIGTDKSHTTDRLREAAVRTFEDVGWTVAVDRPFSGALVPMRFYGKDPRVRAIMVEVRRGLYMDERSGAQLARFNDVRARISGAVRAIVAVDASRHEGG